jgi:hypothetical protein
VNAELNIEGGQSVIKSHGAMGATETFDPTDGNVHTATADADCTITLASPAGSGACTLELYITQDGTGGWDLTWPGSVVWPGGVDPVPDTTAGTLTRYVLETLDGGSSWYGVMVGGASGATYLADLLDAAIDYPMEDDTLRYVGGAWVNDNRRWEPVTTNPGYGPELVWDGDAIVMSWAVY